MAPCQFLSGMVVCAIAWSVVFKTMVNPIRYLATLLIERVVDRIFPNPLSIYTTEQDEDDDDEAELEDEKSVAAVLTMEDARWLLTGMNAGFHRGLTTLQMEALFARLNALKTRQHDACTYHILHGGLPCMIEFKLSWKEPNLVSIHVTGREPAIHVVEAKLSELSA